MNRCFVLLGCCIAAVSGGAKVTASDAYINESPTKWVLGTSKVERVITLQDGCFRLVSFRNKTKNCDMRPTGAVSSELSFYIGSEADVVTGMSGGWRLVSSHKQVLGQGELQLDITLQRQDIQVTKSYVVYPKSSIIREWAAIKNTGSTPTTITDPAFLNTTVKSGVPSALDFHWMTGGECRPQAWDLHTEKLVSGKARHFDSYEPMPSDSEAHYAGDGVNAKIVRNGQQIWPENGWQHVNGADTRFQFNSSLTVKKGDQIEFIVDPGNSHSFDTTEFDPTIKYDDGAKYSASEGYSDSQGQNGWRYQYIVNGSYIDMVYDQTKQRWHKQGAVDTPWITANTQHPDANGVDVARVWTAPKDGHISITGSVCNTGNVLASDTGSFGFCGFRMGSSSYAPWAALQNRDSGLGLFIGWDYFGRWKSSYLLNDDGSVTMTLALANYHQQLLPGSSITTPKAFVGTYEDDLDNAGNECLDWQYRYLWNYTRDGWVNAVRMLGYWPKGTRTWGEPGCSWADPDPDNASNMRKVFRMADQMRYCGGDVYHRDWGWWDKAGDWNGPDWNTTRAYLEKSDMKQLIYAFMYTVSHKSKVALEHPDWGWDGFMGCKTLDMGRSDVTEYLKKQLDGFHEKWGMFEWRNDSIPIAPKGDDDTVQLGQDQGLRDIIKAFLDKHPDCSFQGVNAGGNGAGYEYTAFSSTLQFSDGAPGRQNYYGALLFPPDKTSDIPEMTTPDGYDPTYRGKLTGNLMIYGDSSDISKLDGIRELLDIYHYLASQGVVGRWVKVYRPVIKGDEPELYFERLSGDRKKGIIIPKHVAPNTVTIYPKGLIENEPYLLTFHVSTDMATRTGAELMREGITIDKMQPGELIYLNLPYHPGNRLDHQAPTAPTKVTKLVQDNMGYPGVELHWRPSTDNGWISYYEILRDGVVIDKVAKGQYYFDHSVAADSAATYEVRAVDGAGNTSKCEAAKGQKALRAHVYDDDAFSYNGNWTHLTGQSLAYCATLCRSDETGATAVLQCEGKKLLLFVKMGDDCGKIAVSVDGGAEEVVDTYSADDLWGMCVWQKELPTSGTHTLVIKVLGEKSSRSSGHAVVIDGARAEE